MVLDGDAGGAAATIAKVPLPYIFVLADAPPHSLDECGRLLRRLLLGADVVALCVAFLAAELAFGALRTSDLPILLLAIPLWVLLAWSPPLPPRRRPR